MSILPVLPEKRKGPEGQQPAANRSVSGMARGALFARCIVSLETMTSADASAVIVLSDAPEPRPAIFFQAGPRNGSKADNVSFAFSSQRKWPPYRRATDVGRPRLSSGDAAAEAMPRLLQPTNSRSAIWYPPLDPPCRVRNLRRRQPASPRRTHERVVNKARRDNDRPRADRSPRATKAPKKSSKLLEIRFFGIRTGLREKRPVENAQCGCPIQTRPIMVGRQDVQDCHPRQTLRMIKRKTIRDATTSVIANNAEAVT
jgi:hypothetical protein